jgi:hypothetical protein
MSKGNVFVGYQRRYAEAFMDAVADVGGMGKIQYARVRGMLKITVCNVGTKAYGSRYHRSKQCFCITIWDIS